MKNFIRDCFKNLEPYHSSSIPKGVILNANESPFNAPLELINFMKENISDIMLNRYPDTDSQDLINAIAKAYNVESNNVVCGVGSDEIIDCIYRSVLDKDDLVIIPSPSFSMYSQYAMMNLSKIKYIDMKDDFSYDFDLLLKTIRKEQAKVNFICNPNSPTGCILQRDQIEKILQIAEGLVVVDEAYIDFCQEDITSIPLIKKYDNIIVLRTFSKAYCLASARVGYGIASPNIIEIINAVKAPYNQNAFSQIAAKWAIEHRQLFLDNAKRIVAEKEVLQNKLIEAGFKVWPSNTNFIFAELPESCFEKLAKQEVYIRKIVYNNKIYFRITVGTKEENDALIQALKNC